MEDVLAPNAFTMKEFFSFHGDCGQDATLMGLHTRDPKRWPLDGATLDAIVREQLADGYADANLSGGQNIYSIARWLREKQKVPVTVVGWDPNQNTNKATFSLAAFHDALKAQIGTDTSGKHYWKRPVVAEIQATGAGLPEDEHNVQVHFVTFMGVGLPDSGWYRGDGDAVAYNDPNGGLKKPILTPWSEVVAAQPIAWLVIELDAGVATMGIPNGWSDDGKTLTAPNGVTVVRGFRDYVLAYSGGWNQNNWPLNAEFYTSSIEPGNAKIGPGSRQDFRMCSLGITHDEQKGTWGQVYNIWIGQDILAYRAQLSSAQKAASDAQAAEAQAERERDAAQAAEVQAKSQLTNAQTQLLQLQQENAQLKAASGDSVAALALLKKALSEVTI